MTEPIHAGVSLRKFPYPYVCAVALSNDAEYVTPTAFWDLHEFLNTTGDTPLGRGLGLPITDSVFMYSADRSRSFSYFQATSDSPSPAAGWLRDLMRAGCIDVLHSFGDFDGVGGCTRVLAGRALGELEKLGIHLRVWTNHGTADNTQNIGGTRAYYQRGDLPAADEYHTDLTREYGLRFFWLDSNATNRVGQDGRPELGRVLRAALRARRLNPEVLAQATEPLTLVDTLQDGRRVQLFRRYRGPHRPDPGSLPHQLSAENLTALQRTQAYMVVYQHLGCRRAVGRCTNNAPPYLAPEEVEPLRRLADLYHGGQVYVAGVEAMLRYRNAQRGLSWTASRQANGRIVVTITAIAHEVEGVRAPEPADLRGLTFYTPEPGNTEVRLDVGDGPPRDLGVRRNPPDRSGRASVSIPVERWELPPRPAPRFLA